MYNNNNTAAAAAVTTETSSKLATDPISEDNENSASAFIQCSTVPKTYTYSAHDLPLQPPAVCTSDETWNMSHQKVDLNSDASEVLPELQLQLQELQHEQQIQNYTEATQLLSRAEAAVSRGLPKCGDWMLARDLFYEAGALFATGGYPEAAAKSFLHASVLTRAFKNNEETLSALSLAADNLQLAHPALAVEVLNSLASLLLGAGLTLQAARCHREAALLLEQELKDPAQAIVHYQSAMKLYGDKSVTKSITRACMERVTSLKVELRQFSEASELFIAEAAMVTRNLPKTRQYLYALLCLLAEGYGSDDRYFDALYITRKRFDVLQEEEKNLQQGKEYRLIRGIIQANDNGSLNEFDLAVFAYKSCSTTKPDNVLDILVERCRKNLYEHMEQYM